MGWFSRDDITEEGLIQEIAQLLPAALVSPKWGHALVRQVTVEANRAGITYEYLPYVFKILMEQPQGWPRVADREALFIGREIMARAGVVPDYSRAVVLPPGMEEEDAVDTVIQRMSVWCAGPMYAELSTAYDELLFARTGKVPKATEGAIPKNKGYAWLDTMLKRVLPRRPRWVPKNSDLVLRLLPHL
jgi:hypothetical protein